jgi:hypothetical protein
MDPRNSILISLSGVIGALIGVMMTNLVNVWLQERRQQNEDRSKAREMLFSKGEQLVIAAENFAKLFSDVCTNISVALLDSSQNHPVEYADFSKANYQMVLVNMLIRAYFPASIATLEKIESHRISFINMAAQLVQSRVSTQKDERTAKQLILLSTEIAGCVGSLERQILEKIQSLQDR